MLLHIFSINASFIKSEYENGNLFNNTEYTTFNPDDNAVPKDVIQVPNRGYVIIRRKLDNPGTWIFHCHIDFHLSIGMGLGEKSTSKDTLSNSLFV